MPGALRKTSSPSPFPTACRPVFWWNTPCSASMGGVQKIVQNPGLVFILFEYNMMWRQIFTMAALAHRPGTGLERLLDWQMGRRYVSGYHYRL